MAASPRFKIYDQFAQYQGACKEIEGAAALVSFYGSGATIRTGHGASDIVWKDGVEHDGDAGDSYDVVADVVRKRERERQQARRAAAEKKQRDYAALHGGRDGK